MFRRLTAAVIYSGCLVVACQSEQIASEQDLPPNPAPTCTLLKKDSIRTLVLQGQQTQFWCWAASGSMAMKALGVSVSQSDQANKLVCHDEFLCPSKDCAQCKDHCTITGYPPFKEFDFCANEICGRPLTWDEIRQQITCYQRPIVAVFKIGSSTHAMVIGGYKYLGKQKLLTVYDPWPLYDGCKAEIPFEVYEENRVTHVVNYVNIRQVAGSPAVVTDCPKCLRQSQAAAPCKATPLVQAYEGVPEKGK